MNELEDFLERARAEGTLDSAGQFTLDEERANRLLRDFQLADRCYYLLKLVQAAVAGGGSEIHFSLSPTRVEATLFGRDLDFFDTRQVLTALTQSELLQGEDAMAHLAVALNAALALRPKSIEWTAWNAWRQETLHLTRSGSEFRLLRQRPWTSTSMPGYRFVLHREEPPPPPEQTLTWLQQLRVWVQKERLQPNQGMEEHQQLARRCQFSPVVVKLEGRTISQTPETRESVRSRLELYLLDGGLNTFRIPQPYQRRGYTKELLRFSPQPGEDYWRPCGPQVDWRRGRMMAVLKGEERSQISFVHYGVLLETVEVALNDLRGFRVVASTQGLAVDLSQQAVVKNEIYEQRLNEIRQQVLEVLEGDREQLRGCGEPLYRAFTQADVPSDPLLQATYFENGLLKSLVRLETPGVRLHLEETSGFLRTADLAWPSHPGGDPTKWREWVQGAIRCVAAGGFVKFTEADLPGYYHEEGDGIRATFYEDGQLRYLGYFRDGACLGWSLSLDYARHSGQVRYAKGGFDEAYENGKVVRSGHPETGVWSTWVEGWIECVYRDAQL